MDEEERERAEAARKEAAKDKKDKKDKKGKADSKPKPAPKPETTTPKPAPKTTPKPETPATAPERNAAAERALTGSFAANRGRLLFPVAGGYRIVSNFGRTQHPRIPGVQIQNSGIDIEATAGGDARAVFEGTVTTVFRIDGYHNIVIVRHGEYLTVYAGLDRIYVRKGDKLRTGQAIGHIFADPDDGARSVLHFELRREKEKLNPSEWVKP